MNNIPQLNVNNIIEKLTFAYTKMINGNISFKQMPSVMLWGPPGVGKSQLVREVGENIQKNTGKKVNITDVRLILFNPIDLRGIPTSNIDKTLAVWLKPKIFDMDENDDVVNILFLDEISAAPQSVQAAAYQITLDRVIGEHKLPENCIVIAAGNRVTDNAVAYKMPSALANRLLHFEVEPNNVSWIDWAIKHDINEKVIGFLSFKTEYLLQTDTKNSLAFATPRTWEMVSFVLNNINNDIVFSYNFIAGLVGESIASEFLAWSKVYKDLPSIEDIFAGKEDYVPKTTDQLYAVISSMVCYAKQHQKELNLIENSIEYALNFPPDFAYVLFEGYMSIDSNFYKKIMEMPAYQKWLKRNGSIFNGIK